MWLSWSALLPVALLAPTSPLVAVTFHGGKSLALQAAADELANACREDCHAMLHAAQCPGCMLAVDLCDADAFEQRHQDWMGAISSGGDVLAKPAASSEDAEWEPLLGHLALHVTERSTAALVDRDSLRLRLLHGLLLLAEYDPTDPSRRRGSIAASGGDGEAREMAVAERALLRRLGWHGKLLRCSSDAPHGSRRGEYDHIAWGLVAAQRPDAWWLDDLHSHEGRRWRAAATRRFWRAFGRPARAAVFHNVGRGERAAARCAHGGGHRHLADEWRASQSVGH